MPKDSHKDQIDNFRTLGIYIDKERNIKDALSNLAFSCQHHP